MFNAIYWQLKTLGNSVSERNDIFGIAFALCDTIIFVLYADAMKRLNDGVVCFLFFSLQLIFWAIFFYKAS